MPYISKKSRRFIFSFLGALVFACLVQIFSPDIFMLRHLCTIIYTAISIAWMITVQRRVTFSFIKGYLVLGGMSVTILFLLRLMRWEYFSKILATTRLTWYAYYIPVTIIPLLTLLLAFRVGDESANGKKKLDFVLIITWLIMDVFIMTNDIHNYVFTIKVYNDMRREYSFNFGFVIIVAWCAVLTFLSFTILVKRSRNTAAKNLSWIPIGVCLFFSIFIFIYIFIGGIAPHIGDRDIYNFQEVYALMYIGLWEASLRIGLIPSNSDYDDIFKLANVKAAIADDNYNLRYLSNDALPLEKKQIEQAAKNNGLKLDENRKLRIQRLNPGSVLWVEDHTMVNELNMGLQEAIDRISEENSLLEIENDIKAQKQAIEVRNKLYDSISNRTRSQLENIENILEKAELSGENPSDAIKQCAVLGAYVKRQANLSILSEQYRHLKLEELRFAIRESLENVRLLGIDANVSGIRADVEFDGRLLIFAYEIFEATIEAALPKVETISCILLGEEGIKLEILMDTPTSLPDFKAFDVEKYGAVIDVLHEEEGIYVRLTLNERGMRR